MRFICSLCNQEVKPSELMYTDGAGAVAHECCVQREIKAGTLLLPSSIASLSPTVPTSPRKPDDTLYRAMNAGIPIPKKNLAMAISEPCLLPSAPKLCIECQKPAISMCPGCGDRVCQDYGYNGNNCSGRHEGKCERARYFREPVSDLEKAGIILGGGAILIVEKGKIEVSANGGVHNGRKVRVDRKKRGCR